MLSDVEGMDTEAYDRSPWRGEGRKTDEVHNVYYYAME